MKQIKQQMGYLNKQAKSRSQNGQNVIQICSCFGNLWSACGHSQTTEPKKCHKCDQKTGYNGVKKIKETQFVYFFVNIM